MSDDSHSHAGAPRRHLLMTATAGMCAVAVGTSLWGLARTMSPSAASRTQERLTVKLTEIPPGQQRTYRLDGKPLFVRSLTEAEVAVARAVDLSGLRDRSARNANLPNNAEASVENRTVVSRGTYTVVWGICLGLGGMPMTDAGDFGGWYCVNRGDHFDVLGRFRMGGSPLNLPIPAYSLSEGGILTVLPVRSGPSEHDLDRLLYGSSAV